MKRIVQHILNGLAVLSLLLCVATAALWVRSYYATESLRWAKGQLWQSWTCGHGRVLYLRAIANGELERVASIRQIEPPCSDVTGKQWLVKRLDEFAGFGYGTGSSLGYQGRAWVVPLWFLLLLFAPLPLWRAWRWVMARQRQQGRGFDVQPPSGDSPPT
jgi:hypothetical protein